MTSWRCAPTWSDVEDIGRFVDEAVGRWGRIDGIVHNAGRSAAGPLAAVDDATWESDLQLKLMGAVRLTRASLPHLRRSRGAALFTLAMAAKAPGAASDAELRPPVRPAWPS